MVLGVLHFVESIISCDDARDGGGEELGEAVAGLTIVVDLGCGLYFRCSVDLRY